MNIQTIAEHSVDRDLLLRSIEYGTPTVLNLGCRNFIFEEAIENLGCVVYSVDCDPTIQGLGFNFAIVGDSTKQIYIHRNRDPQATQVSTMRSRESIESKTILEFNKMVNIDFWDLIKMDIEGSEYEVIMSMDKPYAKQLSIEFHLHTGRYGETEMLLMENKLLSLGYFPIQHDKTRQHGLSYNYWDSLFILK